MIATDKKLASALVETKEVSKIEGVTKQSGFVYSGLGPDYRVLIRKSRKDAQKYGRLYGEEQPVSFGYLVGVCVCVCVILLGFWCLVIFELRIFGYGNDSVEILDVWILVECGRFKKK